MVVGTYPGLSDITVTTGSIHGIIRPGAFHLFAFLNFGNGQSHAGKSRITLVDSQVGRGAGLDNYLPGSGRTGPSDHPAELVPPQSAFPA